MAKAPKLNPQAQARLDGIQARLLVARSPDEQGAILNDAMGGAIDKFKTAGANYGTALDMASWAMIENVMLLEQSIGAMEGGINALIGAGLELTDLNRQMVALIRLGTASMNITRGVISVYRVWKSYLLRRAQAEMAAAAAETTAHLAAQDYFGVAMAIGAVAIFSGSLFVGYSVGAASRPDSTHEFEASIDTAAGRREVQAAIRGVS